jgi:hypothetical protein
VFSFFLYILLLWYKIEFTTFLAPPSPHKKIKQIPTDVGHWKRIVKSKYPYVKNNVVVVADLTLFELQLSILMPLKE